MTTAQEALLETLEDLGAEDFEKFRWYLCQQGALEGFQRIKKCHLENASRENTVDHMIQTYSEHAVTVATVVLEKIGRNDMVKTLSKTKIGTKGKSVKWTWFTWGSSFKRSKKRATFMADL